MRSFFKVTSPKLAAALLSAAVLCGFDGQTLVYKLNAFRGLPVDAAIARFGEPYQRKVVDGARVYYWTSIYINDTHYACRIWAKLDRDNIVMVWGYQDCAF
jgi:hypothetical protein